VCPTTARTLERGTNRKEEQQHSLIGQTIGGKYLVKRVLGEGGMGQVFECENTLLRRMVAVKVVNERASKEAVMRLEREALLVAAVQHPNICDVYDFGTLSDGSPYIVLERLFGETLASLLRRSRTLKIPFVVEVFSQMLSGLQAAHGAQIVHRDLKPQNVFLVDRVGLPPLVKLLDFGMAKDISGNRAGTITRPGSVFGTVQYMAPEVLRGERVDPRTDIFAVGVMLYEVLTGETPFHGDTVADVQANILRSTPEPITKKRPELPPDTAEIVLRALAKEPAKRWANAYAMQNALLKTLGSRIMRAARPETIPPPSGKPPPDSV
jgi:serine/threonine-protein kinase